MAVLAHAVTVVLFHVALQDTDTATGIQERAQTSQRVRGKMFYLLAALQS